MVMTIRFSHRTKLGPTSRAALGVACLLSSVAASASNVTLSGSGQMFWTAQFLGSASGNTQTTPSGSYGNTYTLAVPGEYSFVDAFTAAQAYPLLNSSNQPFEQSGTNPPPPVGEYDFQDTYEFSVSQAANGDVLAVSLALQAPFQSLFNISDLQFRLYEVTSSSTPGLTPPTGSTIISKWQGVSGNDNGQSISADFSDLQAGTYFLDIAGTADGSSGGTYVGQLNLSPAVPLPAALPLLLSGLAGLGVMGRRRNVALAHLAS